MNVWRKALRFLRPPEKLSPSEWAEKNIRIPQGNAIPGLIRFRNAPYQREPLDMICNPDCEHITLMWGAQVGKTQLINCAIGYHIAHRPESQMMMQPTQGDLQTWLATKLDPLVEANPELSGRIAKARGREGVNNQRMKQYPGGFLMFSWAGAPTTMRGRSAPKIYTDEVDGYPVTPEGHPVSLLWQRAATFGEKRLLMETSTPTIKDLSKIESSFLDGDQRRYYIPCPHCETFQTLKWAQVIWSKDETGEDLTETATYHCEACGAAISDGQKIAALRRGEWRASKPFRGHASYHLSELYSAFRKWRDIARSFVEKKKANDLQTFINVSLAETWEEAGERADAGSLLRRVESYRAQVPMGAVYLTAGIDMQMDRLEVEVVGWGLGEESWSVDYRILYGDPLGTDVWEQLDELLAETYVHESGAVLSIMAACLDTGGTGGSTQAAYQYARGKTPRGLYPIKGVPGFGVPVVSKPNPKKSGQRTRQVDLWPVGVDDAKLIIMRRLLQQQPGPGYCHFPSDRNAEYFAQLTAERLVTRQIKGRPVREWHQLRPRNEALDCRVYALAALKIKNPNLRRVTAKVLGDAEGVEQTPRPVELEPVTPIMPPSMTTPPEAAEAERPKTKGKWRKKSSSGWT